MKHANPCGVAVDADQFKAYQKAYACDPVSIFGGIVAVNRTLEAKVASELVKLFLEVVIAPDATPKRWPSSPPRRTCACCWPAPCPIRRRPA